MYNSKDTKVIKVSQIINFLIVFPHLKTAYMNQMPLLDNMFNLFRLASGMIIFYIVLKNNKLNQIISLFIFFQAILIASTVMHNGDLKTLIFDTYSIITLSIYLDYKLKNNTLDIIKTFLLCFEIQIYINLMTIILFPNGLYTDWTNNNWFLGTDNQHVAYYICGICLTLIHAKLTKQWLRAFSLMTASYISVFWVWSATAVSGVLLYSLLLLLYIYYGRKIFNYRNLSLVYLIAFFSIIVFQLQNMFSFFIVDFLGKSLTFTGRIYIWERAIYWIKNSWVIGYGNEYPALHTYKTIFPYCHNILLEHMYQGGILLILCLIYIHITIGKRLMIYSGTYYSKVVSVSIFILYFMMLFENYSMVRVYPILLLAFHMDKLLIYDKRVNHDGLNKHYYSGVQYGKIPSKMPG